MLKVMIMSDGGQYSVGIEPEKEAMMETTTPGQDMAPGRRPEYQPAKDLEDALNQARQLLMQDQQAQPQGQSPFDQGMESVAPMRG